MRCRALQVAALSAIGACASISRHDGDIGPIAGSEPSLQPHIASASASTGTRILVSFEVPQRSYVSFLRVHTQASIAVLTTSGKGPSTAAEATEPGTHKINLEATPLFLSANAQRTGRVVNRSDATLSATDSPYPIHDYAVVIATAKPLALEDLQAGLDGVDLRGEDDLVLLRVAQAIGTRSGGAWSATAARPVVQIAPF